MGNLVPLKKIIASDLDRNQSAIIPAGSLATKCDATGDTVTCPECGREITVLSVTLGSQTKRIVPRCRCQVEKEEQWHKELKERERKRRIESLFPTWALGQRFQECTFESFKPRPGTENALKAAQEFAASFPPADGIGLMFLGTWGNGKSHLAAAIVHAVKAQGHTAVFASVPEVLSRIRATYNDEARETEAQLMFGLREAKLTVLDDLGAEKKSNWTLEKVYELIDARYRARRPTIVTSNLTPEELEEQIGPRAYDRLLEMCLPVVNRGTSYRREVAAKRMKGGA